MSRRLLVVIAALALIATARCRRADPGPGTNGLGTNGPGTDSGRGTRHSGLTASVPIDDGRRWMDAMPDNRAATIERIAAAYSRNQDAANESELLQFIQDGPTADAARLAYVLLSRSYLRRGLYARAIANLDAWAKAFPGDEWLKQDQMDVGQLRGLPDQSGRAPSEPFASRHSGQPGFTASATINKTRVTYLLDTGAWISVMTEAEAQHAGLTIRDTGGTLGDSSGKGVKFRTAVAQDVAIGPVTLHDVSFAILPNVEPWRTMPVGRGGILGVPVLLALECLQWSSNGAWTFGCAKDPSASHATPNLTYFKNHLILATKFEDKSQFVALDTGAETTDLNSTFASEYASLLERHGRKSRTDVAGMGGTSTIESITVPEVRADIAGAQLFLRPGHVTKQDNGAMGGGCCVGNIGLDLLLQTGMLTIDFRRMTLRVK